MSEIEEKFMLKPSVIETAGVGCFAVCAVEEGTRLAVDGHGKANRLLSQHEIPDSHLKYCPLLESGYFLAPASFATMSVFWYINHSRNPNIIADKWRLFAGRDIEAREELYLYYPDLLTHPKNTAWVIPEIHI